MKNILAALIGVTVVVGLASCATTKDWAATGGSRSDGTIKLSYQYGMFESPKVSEQQAVELATSKCVAWDTPEPKHLAVSSKPAMPITVTVAAFLGW